MGKRDALRNFVFGAEDSLVSTVGLLSGVSFAGLTNHDIIISGVILILVEALSMGAGVYISEDSANDLAQAREKEDQTADAVVMFISYLAIGLIPLLPYLLVDDTRLGFYYSITVTIISLFLLGLFKGYYVKKPLWKSALKITIIGTTVALLAIFVGSLIK